METQLPEYQTHEEYQNRRRKLNEIKEAGIDPYPHKFEPTTRIEQILEKYEKEEVGDSEAALLGKTPSARLGGRLILFRPMGKNAFGQLQEESSRIQILLNRDATKVAGLSEESGLAPLKFVEKMIDLGDLIGVEGALFRTHKGELTLFVKTLTLLCKTLLPLPDKHSGLADKGVRYRKRWLDLIVHPEVAKQLKMRSSIVRFVRTFFEEQGFLEESLLFKESADEPDNRGAHFQLLCHLRMDDKIEPALAVAHAFVCKAAVFVGKRKERL